MQWLIDLVIEAIGIPPVYIDRGDPARFDYIIGDFIVDGAWHELDLSAIVPEKVTAITISVSLFSSLVHQRFQLRTHGNTNAKNISHLLTQNAFILTGGDMIVSPDTDRKIDYWVTATLDLGLDFTVKGWWL